MSVFYKKNEGVRSFVERVVKEMAAHDRTAQIKDRIADLEAQVKEEKGKSKKEIFESWKASSVKGYKDSNSEIEQDIAEIVSVEDDIIDTHAGNSGFERLMSASIRSLGKQRKFLLGLIEQNEKAISYIEKKKLSTFDPGNPEKEIDNLKKELLRMEKALFEDKKESREFLKLFEIN